MKHATCSLLQFSRGGCEAYKRKLPLRRSCLTAGGEHWRIREKSVLKKQHLDTGDLPAPHVGTVLPSLPHKQVMFKNMTLQPVSRLRRAPGRGAKKTPSQVLLHVLFVEMTVSLCYSLNLAVPAHFKSMETCPNKALTSFQL